MTTHHDLDLGPEEGQIIIAPVPDDHVRLRLRAAQDGLVIDSGVHHRAMVDVRLVLLHLLDRAILGLHVLHAREALDLLPPQVAVRHRMPDHDHPLAGLTQDLAHAAARLALAAAGAHGAHRDDRNAGFEQRVRGPEEPEVGAHSHGA
jgi:hypothetical protein